MFRVQLIGLIFKVFLFLTLEMGLIGYPEISVRNYHYSLRINPEVRSSLLRDGSQKSRTAFCCQSVSGVNCCIASDSREWRFVFTEFIFLWRFTCFDEI